MGRSIFIKLAAACIFLLYPVLAYAGVEFFSGASSEGEMPFWLHANRWGVIDRESAQAGLLLNYSGDISIYKDIRAGCGIRALGRISENETAGLNEGYVSLSWRQAELKAGRSRETIGETQEKLSTGSMIASGNAVPIPKVELGLKDYMPVPFSYEVVNIRGMISHGWLGDNRYIKDAWLHEKNLYLKLKSPFGLSLYGGVIHDVIWAGTTADGEDLPDTWDDYYRIFFNENGGGDAPANDRVFRLGDSKGLWDMGILYSINGLTFRIYYQHFFEDKTSMEFRNRYDGLWGLGFIINKKKIISEALFEFLYTKFKSGDIGPISGWGLGNDNYYYNEIYRSGWTYKGRVIGNPFIVLNDEGTIINNRAIVYHAGICGYLTEDIEYRMLNSFSINYGTYLVPFENKRHQNSFLLELNFKNIYSGLFDIFTGFGFDTGELYEDNYGLLAGIDCKWF